MAALSKTDRALLENQRAIMLGLLMLLPVPINKRSPAQTALRDRLNETSALTVQPVKRRRRKPKQVINGAFAMDVGDNQGWGRRGTSD